MSENLKKKLKIIFSKTGDMKFISHLDLLRLFQRSSRRADLPVVITQGFSPRLKISISKALKLGVESRAEEAVFYIKGSVDPDFFKRSMNSKLPEGIRIEDAKEIV